MPELRKASISTMSAYAEPLHPTDYHEPVEPDMRCDTCGYRWHGGWHQPDRHAPPEPRVGACPRCEGDIHDENIDRREAA